jgi:putative transposase
MLNTYWELRKIIYIANTLKPELGMRKYTKPKTRCANENAASKPVFLSIQNIEKSWTSVTNNREIILHQYIVIFNTRCRL